MELRIGQIVVFGVLALPTLRLATGCDDTVDAL